MTFATEDRAGLVQGFSILDFDCIIFPRSRGRSSRYATSIDVYRIDVKPVSHMATFTQTAIFELPRLATRISLSSLKMAGSSASNPFPHSSTPPSSNTPSSSSDTGRYFRATADSHILSLIWTIEWGRNQEKQEDLIMFVHASLFTENNAQYDGTYPMTWLWEAWGETHTRVFKNVCKYTSHQYESTRGSRFAHTVLDFLSILDFRKNPIPSASHAAVPEHQNYLWDPAVLLSGPKGNGDKPQSTLAFTCFYISRSTPTTIHSTAFADGVICSSLPYCISTRRLRIDITRNIVGIFVSDEGIVCNVQGKVCNFDLIVFKCQILTSLTHSLRARTTIVIRSRYLRRS